MKKLAVALLLLSCVPVLPAQKTRFGQPPPKAKPGVNYPLKVHISSIHLSSATPVHEFGCDGCYDMIRVDAAIEQKNVELTGYFLYTFSQVQLTPGDYYARLVKAVHDSHTAPLFNEYEIVLPDRTIWRGTVTGISE
jgi:hypothetical protein